MKSVLILANHDVGLYNFRAELIEQLIQQGFDVHFSVPFGEKVHLIEKMGAIYHPAVINRRGRNPLQDLALFFHYLGLIRSLRPSAVLTYTAKANIYGGMACRITGVSQLANITGLGSELSRDGRVASLLRWLYRVGLSKSHTIFFQNESNKLYFLQRGLINARATGAGRPQVMVLPGSGVDVERFRPDPHKEFSDIGKARFLFISRIMKDKGIEEFLDASEKVKRLFPESQMDILGFYESEEYRKRVETLQAQGVIGDVIFSDDTRVEMHQADCVVLPSYHEGMSNVLLEAAASGLPIITSDIPGCREAVIDGCSGYLSEVRDANQLQDRMIRIIHQNSAAKQAMGTAGRKWMMEKFDRNQVIDAYMKCLENILNK